jgi:hypothetical protein
MRILVAALCAAFSAAVPAAAQAADPIAACADRLVPYADRVPAPESLVPLEISSAPGHLTYFGASHSFDPLKSSAETGGIFTNDVNRASSEFRTRHMYTVLATAAARADRVFAVVGRDHVPAQAAALRCALAGAR